MDHLRHVPEYNKQIPIQQYTQDSAEGAAVGAWVSPEPNEEEQTEVQSGEEGRTAVEFVGRCS